MTEDDKPGFVSTLRAMSEIYGAPMTAEALTLWWRLLAPDWTLTAFHAATATLCKSKTFMPRPADYEALRRAAGRASGPEAWAQVLAEVRQHCRGPISPAIDRAVRELGGYERVANCADERLGFLERSFLANYEGGATVEEARAALPAGVRRLT